MVWVLVTFLILAPRVLLAEVTENSFGVVQSSADFSTITSAGNTTLATMDANKKVGFCAGKCGGHMNKPQPVKVSSACANFIDSTMPACLKKVGCHDRAVFCGVGGHAARLARDSDKASNHSVGDALDIFGLRCYDKTTKNAVNVDFTKAVHDGGGKAAQVYKGLVSCWREAVREYQQKTGTRRGGAIACEGHSEPANKLHNDHIHISCPVSRNGYKPPLIGT